MKKKYFKLKQVDNGHPRRCNLGQNMAERISTSNLNDNSWEIRLCRPLWTGPSLRLEADTNKPLKVGFLLYGESCDSMTYSRLLSSIDWKSFVGNQAPCYIDVRVGQYINKYINCGASPTTSSHKKYSTLTIIYHLNILFLCNCTFNANIVDRSYGTQLRR